MKTIRLAIIGTGGMAHSHALGFSKQPGVSLGACCDVNGKVVKKFAAAHGIRTGYGDYRELLAAEELDAVSVVASDSAHCAVSVAALRKGLHVLCEKPLATSVAEARRMVRAARKAKKVNMINFTYREMPALERARQLVAEGTLGRIIQVEASYLQSWLANDHWGDWRKQPRFLWRLSKKHGGGTLADIGCHILDFVRYAVGDIRRISCKMKRFDKGAPRNTCKGYKLDADDSFIASVEFASGGLGVIHATRWAAGCGNDLRLRIFGDKGSLAVDTQEDWDKLQVCVEPFHTRHTIWDAIDAGIPRVNIYQRFIRGIRAGRPEPPSFEDGLKVQRYLEACTASNATGKAVTLGA